ncbi:LEA domain protein [Aspergillus sclerotiicarbonarius CBS 121057]|uniref:LEA domain protein n=1 Tax=Aspergillus sclerotiicarbonarius (strain CBS 121057 / IBT 28362) TaxID=1448318 RepID=A0A319EN24_ASPSB|nr:LEA domain protein [Aspergillus sclerotiicarbonarius CBS 121057]
MASPIASKVSKLNLSPDSKRGTPTKLRQQTPAKKTPPKLRSQESGSQAEEPSAPSTPTPKGKVTQLLSEQRASPSLVPEDVQSLASGSASQIGRPVSGLAEKAEETAESVNGEQDVGPIDLSVLKGLQVGEDGLIHDQDGNAIGRLVEGQAEHLVGYSVGDNGEILDEDGDLVGVVDVLPDAFQKTLGGIQEQAQETPGQAAKTVTDIAELADRPLTESGEIKDDEGNTIGNLVEGKPEDLAGYAPNKDGDILDDDGDLIGRVEIAPEAQEAAEDVAESVAETKPITDIAALAERPVSASGAIKDDKGKRIGKLVEGDPEELAGYAPNTEGEILDDDGDLIGRVEIASQARQGAASVASSRKPPSKLSREAVEDVEQRDTSTVDEVTGSTKKPAEAAEKAVEDAEQRDNSTVDEAKESAKEPAEPDEDAAQEAVEDAEQRDASTVDEAMESAKEWAEPAEDAAEEAVEEAEDGLPPLSILEGLRCNKLGKIVDQTTGKPVGELIEGDEKKISRLGAQLDDKGQFWDNRGNVIGKAKTLPVEEHPDEPPFGGLEGLHVVEDGWVEDQNGKRVGKVSEGDPKKVLGRAVDEDGDVLDKNGNIIAKAEYYEPEPEEPEPEPEAPDLSSLEGLTPNKLGYVIGPKGVPIGRVVEGKVKELAGKEIHDGQVWDGPKPIGRVELIPQGEREKSAEGPFAGLDNLVVNKEGLVEDDDGNIVGKVIEGDIKTLRGRAVDEDGEIIDKYGNVKGRAEPYEEEVPEEEAPDLSILEGKTVNKAGNVVDAQGNVFGRITSGDKRLAGRKVDGKGQIWGDDGKVIGTAELIPGAEQQKPEGAFYGFENALVGKDGVVTDASGQIIGRVIEGDAQRLQGRLVDEDGDILDKNGNTIGRAERWQPEEKERSVNPMSGRKVNREGEVRDADGNLIGKLTSGNLPSLIGKEIDDNGYVVDNDGNKIGECTLIENIPEPEPEEPEPEPEAEPEPEEPGLSPEELEAQKKLEDDRQLAKKMSAIIGQTLDRLRPICKMISELIEKAERTPKDELDEEQLVKDVKPLLEEGNGILQECNGAIRALDPDGHIAAAAKARAASHDATPEEYALAENLKELTNLVLTTIDNAKKKIAGMPHAKKQLNPLWALLSEPLGQIITAVGLLLTGVLGLVGRLLQGLGLGPLVNGLLAGLGLDKLLGSLGLTSLTDALGLTGRKK